jgi:hypothetical protein
MSQHAQDDRGGKANIVTKFKDVLMKQETGCFVAPNIAASLGLTGRLSL